MQPVPVYLGPGQLTAIRPERDDTPRPPAQDAVPSFDSFVNVRDAVAERARVRAQLAAMCPEDNVVRRAGPAPETEPLAMTAGGALAVGGTVEPIAIVDNGTRGELLHKDYEDPFSKRTRLGGKLRSIKDWLCTKALLYAERYLAPKLEGQGPILLAAGPEGDQPKAVRLSSSDTLILGLSGLMEHYPRLSASELRERTEHLADARNRVQDLVDRHGPDFIVLSGMAEARAPVPAPQTVAQDSDPDRGELCRDPE